MKLTTRSLDFARRSRFSTFFTSCCTDSFAGSILRASLRSNGLSNSCQTSRSRQPDRPFLASDNLFKAILACARLNKAFTFVAFNLRTVVQSLSASSFLYTHVKILSKYRRGFTNQTYLPSLRYAAARLRGNVGSSGFARMASVYSPIATG